MKRLSLYLLFLFSSHIGWGQNLILNPGLELNSGYPSEYGQVSLINDWINPSTDSATSPDYFHTLGQNNYTNPTTLYGGSTAHSGDAFFAIGSMFYMNMPPTTFDSLCYREYMTATLSSPLTIGAQYKLSYFIKNMDNVDTSYMITCSNHGALFTSYPINQETFQQTNYGPTGNTLQGNPTPQVLDLNVLIDTSWTLKEYIFTADSAYEYVTFGLFGWEDQISFIPQLNHNGDYSYQVWFYDDFSLIQTSRGIIADLQNCFGDSSILVLPSSDNPQWYESNAPNILLSSSDTLIVSPNQTTEYFCVDGADTFYVEVVVIHPPTLSLDADSLFCEGEGITLNIQHTGDSLIWHSGVVNQDYYTTVEGFYLVESVNQCGSDSDSINLTEIALPDLQITPYHPVCEGTEIVVDLTHPWSGYSWSHGPTTPQVTLVEEGHYTGTLHHFCGDFEYPVTIEFIRDSLVTFPDSIGLCNGNAHEFDFTSYPFNFLWNNSVNSPIYLVDDPGYTYLVYERSCDTIYDSVYAKITFDLPVYSFPDYDICLGDSMLFEHPVDSVQFRWMDAFPSRSRWIKTEGHYIFEEHNLCFNDFDTLFVHNLDTAYLPPIKDMELCEDEHVFYSFYREGIDFLWSDGSTQPFRTFMDEETLVLESSNLCFWQTDTIQVSHEKCECKIYIPNSFTPNGDQYNNTWSPKLDCELSTYEVQIFNRWGELVFISNKPHEVWDGTFQGKLVTDGVYSYRVAYSLNESDKKIEVGTIALIK